MKKIVTFPIDGAVSMADLEIQGEKISLPKMNPAYKFCLVGTDKDGSYILVSKDGKGYSLAVAVKIGKKEYSRDTLLELYRRVYNG